MSGRVRWASVAWWLLVGAIVGAMATVTAIAIATAPEAAVHGPTEVSSTG